jgi:hypothetical protein
VVCGLGWFLVWGFFLDKYSKTKLFGRDCPGIFPISLVLLPSPHVSSFNGQVNVAREPDDWSTVYQSEGVYARFSNSNTNTDVLLLIFVDMIMHYSSSVRDRLAAIGTFIQSGRGVITFHATTFRDNSRFAIIFCHTKLILIIHLSQLRFSLLSLIMYHALIFVQTTPNPLQPNMQLLKKIHY